MKRVKCKSGIMGWETKLRTIYENRFTLFRQYSETFGLAQRLGYKTAEAAWRYNPTIRGSVNASDYMKVKK